MNHPSPKISVIITTYNRPDLLKRAIESVLNQNYDDFECVVVDDYSSTRKAKEIVESFGDDRLSYTRHNSNQGLSAARNTGISQARGTYVAFLDDDDKWAREKLSKQVAKFESLSEEYAIIYCWMNYRRQTDEKVVKKYKPSHRGYIFPKTLDDQPIGSGSTLLIRKDVAQRIEFDTKLSRGIDGDFIRRVCKEYKVEFVPKILVDYYIEHNSERITREDEQGIRNAIQGKQTKLRKFDEELKRYPKRKAMICSNLGRRYWQVGEYINSLKYQFCAIRASPRTIGVYKNILRTIRDFLF